MTIDLRIMKAIGYLASAYVHREKGRFKASGQDVNHAIEVMLLGRIRIPWESDDDWGDGEFSHTEIDGENDQPYERGKDFG